jgi:hypothetical protein
VQLVNGFVPAPTDAFTIINAGFMSGSFANVPFGGLVYIDGSYDSFEVQRVGNTVRLTSYQIGPVTFTRWAQLHGLSGAEAGWSADPDFDGLPNLLEYGLGLRPDQPNASGITVTRVEHDQQRYLALSYSRPAGAEARHDITYTGARATALEPGHWSSEDVVLHSVTPGPGETETVVLRSAIPLVEQTAEFLRLFVTLAAGTRPERR